MQFIDSILQPSITTKFPIWQIIDDAAKTCISCSQRIFLAWNCRELVDSLIFKAFFFYFWTSLYSFPFLFLFFTFPCPHTLLYRARLVVVAPDLGLIITHSHVFSFIKESFLFILIQYNFMVTTDKVRYLGVIINSKLELNDHCQCILSKATTPGL